MSENLKFVTVGIDVGQQNDPTAIAVVLYPYPGAANQRIATVKHLERLPLGTSYPDVKIRILNIVYNLQAAFMEEVPGRYQTELRVDATGVGRGLVDMLREAAPALKIYGVTLTAGHEQTRKGWDWYVPKLDLVTVLTRYLAERRLRLPPTSEARAFQRELRQFQGRKESAQHVETGARSGQHDDLVIAVGLGLLSGRQTRRPSRQRPAVFGDAQRSRTRAAGLSAQQQQLQSALDAMAATRDEDLDDYRDRMHRMRGSIAHPLNNRPRDIPGPR